MTEEKANRLSIYGKLAKVSAAVAYLQKDGTNQAQRYSYVSEAHVKKAVTAAIVDAGLSYGGTDMTVLESWESETKSGARWRGYVVQAQITITDPEGSGAVTFTGLGSGMDAGDKAVAKAQAQAVKYALMTGLGISTGDDPEADEQTDAEMSAPPPRREVRRQPEAQAPRRPVEGAQPSVDQRSPAAGAPGEWVAPYGNCKGQTLSQMTIKDANWYQRSYASRIQREPESRYLAEWNRSLDTIEAYLRIHADSIRPDTDRGAPEKHERHAPDQGAGYDDDDQFPF